MKLLKVLFVVTAGLILLVAVALFVAAKSDPKRFAIGRGKALRSEAKILLRSAQKNNFAYQNKQKRFADSVDVVFDNGKPFNCKAGSPCLHYLYSVQASCENGGKLFFPRQSELALIGQSDSKIAVMKQALVPFVSACKSSSQGFNVFAAGDIREGGLFDIVSIDETGGEIKILQDALGTFAK